MVMDSYADLTAFSQRKRKVGKGGAVSAVTMKITLVLAATLSVFVFACDKSSSSGATGTTTASSVAASGAPAPPGAKGAEPRLENGGG
jgi:hypothetical protein